MNEAFTGAKCGGCGKVTPTREMLWLCAECRASQSGSVADSAALAELLADQMCIYVGDSFPGTREDAVCFIKNVIASALPQERANNSSVADSAALENAISTIENAVDFRYHAKAASAWVLIKSSASPSGANNSTHK